MSRIAGAFGPNQLALFPYLMAGYPDGQSSAELARTIIAAVADGLEIGIPFSDPMADGLTLQRANEQALGHGATTLSALHLAQTARAASASVPIIFMSYYNPIMAFGEGEFCRTAKEAGADGVIVPDLPPEEAIPMRQACQSAGLDLIFLLAPTSTAERIELVAGQAQGFIYCVGLVGVTGARSEISTDLEDFLARVRRATSIPLVVGFGISKAEHVRALHGRADGVIVASALADLIEATPPPQRSEAIAARIRELKAATELSPIN